MTNHSSNDFQSEYLPELDTKRLSHLNDDQRSALNTLEKEFEVNKSKLDSIVQEFEEEFRIGLTNSVRTENKESGVDDSHLIPMLPTYIHDVPRGDEKGTFLALDLGGTNLRVCEVNLNGDKSFTIKSNKYILTDQHKTGTAEDLFDYIADCVKLFMLELGHRLTHDEKFHLGFTFSFPVLQTALDQGKLLGWTKGFKASGAIGNDVVKLLQNALDKKQLNVYCNALVNDTVGTLMARAYQSGSALVGAIFGTGTNGAYVERLDAVKKLSLIPNQNSKTTSNEVKKMIINTEWGAFDNLRKVLPITKYDNKLDRQSINPRRQTFEKMISGMYLGELTRNVLVDLIDRNLLFRGYSSPKLNQHYGFDTAIMSSIDNGDVEVDQTSKWIEKSFGIKGNAADWIIIERVCELIGTRAARLSATAIGAVIRQTGSDSENPTGDQTISIGVDGSVIERYARFIDRLNGGLKDLFDQSVCDRIEIELAKDGSGVGAALCALQAKKQEGKD